jgi:DNA-binding beta-propeller fold protein YncE
MSVRLPRGSPAVLALAAVLAGGCSGASPESATTGTPSAPKVSSTAPSDSPSESAAIGRDRVFVALEGEAAIAVLSGPPWRRIGKIPVAAGPHNAEATSDGQYVVVSSPPSDVVTIVRGRDARVVRRVRITGSPHDVAFTSDGRYVWVTAERGGRLVQVSVPNGRIRREIDVGGDPHDLAISSRRDEMWITVNDASAVQVRSQWTVAGSGTSRPVTHRTTSPSARIAPPCGSAIGTPYDSPRWTRARDA